MKIHEYNQMMKWLTAPRPGLAKGKRPEPKENKTLQYINDMKIVHKDKKATKAEAEAAAKRVESFQEQYEKYFKNNINKKVAKIPVIPPKPDLVNGHSDWNTEDWLESIDPGGWANEDKRRSGILEFELANEYWQDQYQQYLDGGGTLGFDAWYQGQINKKISREINKRVKDKQKTEGLAAIIGISPNKI